MKIFQKLIKSLIAFQLANFEEGNIEKARVRQNLLAKLAPMPKGILSTPIVANGVSARWIEPRSPENRIIIYLHGGGFVLGSVDSHKEWIARLADATKSRCLAVEYRLAPEHPFPAGLEDTLKVYEWVLRENPTTSEIYFAGDSAGGGLAVAALISLRDKNEPLPKAAFCFSPWFDLSLTGESIRGNAEKDPILRETDLKLFAKYYAGDQVLSQPLLSPLNANLERLPPIILHVGSDEILLSDSVRFANKAQKSGVNVILQVWKKQFHGYQMVPFLPETKQSLTLIANYLSKQIKQDRI
jgi:acetyl esterase/lipase